MNFSDLLPGDSFRFADNPEIEYIKMSNYGFRKPFTSDPVPVSLTVNGNPEVVVIHEGFLTFAQLEIGDQFRFTERRTLLCVKSGLHSFQMLNGPKNYLGEEFSDFGDPLVVKEIIS